MVTLLLAAVGALEALIVVAVVCWEITFRRAREAERDLRYALLTVELLERDAVHRGWLSPITPGVRWDRPYDRADHRLRVVRDDEGTP